MKRLFAFGLGACGVALVPTTLAAQAADSFAPTAVGIATPKDNDTLDPASLAIARQILTIAFPPEKRVQMYRDVMQAIVDQSIKAVGDPGTVKDKDFQAILDRSTRRAFEQLTEAIIAASPDYFECMARAYARGFSRDDLNAVLAFVRTPAGQRYFERAPLLLKDPDVQAASQRMMAKVIERAPEITRETAQEIEAYRARKSR
ncbi:MAG TPA: DUF2059 domain-containing protein [Allosphingosinicella sp.]|jgi:hypothetical protein|nr:DUF2059 domain-containing protein [Allosphingosinicella sp.]